MKKLLLGAAVSILFVYLSIKDIHYQSVISEFKHSNFIYLLPGAIITVFISFLKSIRLGIILSPFENMKQNTLFPITCAGNLCTVLIPMRLGELIRAYLIFSSTQSPYSSSFAVIFIERIFDLACILVILSLVAVHPFFPGWVVSAGYSLMVCFGVSFVFILFLSYRKKNAIDMLLPIILKLPPRLQEKAQKSIGAFIDGMGIMHHPKKIFYACFMSLVIWGFAGLGFYVIFPFIHLKLPFVVGYVLVLFTSISVSIPTSPGFLGNYHYGCIFALTLFDVPKTTALAFALASYMIGVFTLIVLGLLFLPAMPISIKEIKRRIVGLNIVHEKGATPT